MVDDITGQCKKVGFARIKVVINSAELLVPGVQIRGENTVLWQPFVAENIPSFCYHCGRIGHELGGCHFPSPLPEEELGRRLMVVETAEALGAEGGGGTGAFSQGRRSVFGPWLATTRIRPPRTTKTSSPVKKAAGSSSGPAGPGESSAGQGKASSQPSSPDSPPESATWEKPAKVARRRSPPKEQQGGSGVMVCGSASVFDPILEPDPLEEDLGPGLLINTAGPEVIMAEPSDGSLHHKRARSPLRSGPLPGKEADDPVRLGAKRDGVSGEGASGGASAGRRLPDSWRVSLPATASTPGHMVDGRSTEKGKEKVSSLVRRACDATGRPEGAAAAFSSQPVGKGSGKEEGAVDISQGGHGRAVWRAKEALGLHEVQKDPAHSQTGTHHKMSQSKTVRESMANKEKSMEAQALPAGDQDCSQVGEGDGPSAGERGPGLAREF